MVYMTVGSEAEAESLSRALLKRRLVACVNIIGGVTSLYHWQGKIAKEPEFVMIAKTCEHHVAAIRELVDKQHPYECPCVITLPITGGNKEFLDWIEKSVE